MNKLTPDKIEIATLRRVDGKTVISIMENEEMNKLIKKFEDAEKAAEEAKKEKEAAKGEHWWYGRKKSTFRYVEKIQFFCFFRTAFFK